MRTKVQEDILESFPTEFDIIDTYDYKRDGNGVDMEIIALCADSIYRFTVDPHGDALCQELRVAKETNYYGWSMEEHDWVKQIGIHKEETGDVYFDVVAKEEIKEEKKVARDFSIEASDMYLDTVREYVRRHQDELKEYAKDSYIEHFAEQMDEDIEGAVKDAIDNHFLSYDFSDDVQIDDCDIESILEDYDII